MVQEVTGNDTEEVTPIPETVVEIRGRHFALKSWSPRRGCNFQLEMSGVTLHGRLCDPRPNLPNLYVEIGSEPFWLAPDWRSYLLNWSTWLRGLARQTSIEWHVTRADLAFHTQRLTVDHLDRKLFSCRALNGKEYSKDSLLARLEKAYFKDDYARQSGGDDPAAITALIGDLHKTTGLVNVDFFKGEVKQMITFGTRGRLYCRLYNKSAELLRSPLKRTTFAQVWQHAGFDPERDVINVEFEIQRAWFQSREFVTDGKTVIIDTLGDLIANYDALCAYFVGSDSQQGWLRMVDPMKTATGADQRKTRCETSTVWELLREATQLLPEVSARERTAKKARYSVHHHLPHIVRCVARMDAALGREFDMETITDKAILERMAALIIQEQATQNEHYSDLALESTYRAERIRLIFAPQFPEAIAV